jgi:hypothetical protein
MTAPIHPSQPPRHQWSRYARRTIDPKCAFG